MIPRYSRPEMVAIWTPESRFRIWFEIEAHALPKRSPNSASCPRQAARRCGTGGRPTRRSTSNAIDAIEAVTKHDVIAFLTWVAEHVGDEARFMHQGMTSSDVLDTCLAVQLARAADLLIADVDRAARRARTPRIRAQAHPHDRPQPRHPRRARHLRAQARLQAHAEFARCRNRLVAAREDIATCAISGAVGTFANIDPRVEELCRRQRWASRSSRSRHR